MGLGRREVGAPPTRPQGSTLTGVRGPGPSVLRQVLLPSRSYPGCYRGVKNVTLHRNLQFRSSPDVPPETCVMTRSRDDASSLSGLRPGCLRVTSHPRKTPESRPRRTVNPSDNKSVPFPC